MRDEKNKKILSEIESGYDLIAEKFSGTRAFMWRDLGFVRDMVKPGDRVLDFGCGNGRLAGYLENNYAEYVGVDISSKLIGIAKQRYHNEKTEFIKIDPRSEKMPFKDNHFDVVFSIAVFHHFPSKEYSMQIAEELHRALKPGGKIVITVWNLWQKQYLKYHKGSGDNWLEAKIPFKAEGKVFYRYHHPFKAGELEILFEKAGFKKVKTKEGWNLVYVGSKKNNLEGSAGTARPSRA